MMYDYYLYTGDEKFAKEILIPHANEMTLFYDNHYKRKEGKIFFSPAASLETWHSAEDPLPEIAGLSYLLPKLLSLPEEIKTKELDARWKRMLTELPAIPLRIKHGQKMLAPAVKFSKRKNVENPELYAIFPYRLFGINKETDINLAKLAMTHRLNKKTFGWQQSEIQQAYLGLRDESAKGLLERASGKYPKAAFPVYWNANYDWVPDQCHGSNLLTALQMMIIQCEGKKIILNPALPKTWNADFKLHAPYNTTVEGRIVNGKVTKLKVTPESRAKDVITK